MKYNVVRYYAGRRACTKGIIVEASSEEDAVEKARVFYNNIDDKIVASLVADKPKN